MKQLKFILGMTILTLISIEGKAQLLDETFPVVQDTYVSDIDGIYMNFGTSPYLPAYIDSTGLYLGQGYFPLSSLVSFDFSGIPIGATVISAEMILQIHSAAGTPTIGFHPFLADWDENTVTLMTTPAYDYTRSIYSSDVGTGTADTFDLTTHITNMVNRPDLSFGWYIELTSFSWGPEGVKYYSSDYSGGIKQPVLRIQYLLPIEVTGYAKHATNGNNDGEIEISLSGGTDNYVQYDWFRMESGNLTPIESDTDIDNVNIDNLSPGLYLLQVEDDYGLTAYKYFMIGEEDAVTNVGFYITNTDTSALFNESATSYDIPGFSEYNYTYMDYVILESFCVPAGIYQTNFWKYNIDFDAGLNFEVADFLLYSDASVYSSPHINVSGSSNESRVTLLTEKWYESLVLWKTRPAADPGFYSTLSATPNGSTYRNDTVDLLDYVNYWSVNVDENNGFELGLTSFAQPGTVYRVYGGSGYTLGNKKPRLMVSYTVKPTLEIEYSDSTGLGTITVNAPAGELPYTYLLGYDTIPDLADIWNEVKDSISIDSLTFFRGKSNTREFIFSDLPTERYYIKIFDNKGEAIYDGLALIRPDIAFADKSGIDDNTDSIKVAYGALYGAASLDRVLYAPEDGGFEFKIAEPGNFAFGFNKLEHKLARTTRDFESGFEFYSNGDYDIFVNNVVVYSGTSVVDDIFRMARKADQVIYTQNDDEVYRDTLDTTAVNHLKVDILFKGKDGLLLNVIALEGFKKKIRPGGFKIQQPLCGQENGSISIAKLISLTYPAFPPSSFSYSIIDMATGDPVTSGSVGGSPAIESLPAGDYAITFLWSNGGPIATWTEYFSIYYPVTWTLTNAYFSPYITGVNTLTSTSLFNFGSAESINVLPDDVTYGWVRSNASPAKYYNPLTSPPLKSPFSATISLIDGSGDDVAGVKLYNIGTNMITKYVACLNNVGNYAYSGFWINTNGPFYITLESGDFNVYYGSMSSTSLMTLAQGVPDDYRLKARGLNAQIYDTYASFCVEVPITEDQFVEPKRELTGGYYVVQADDILRFEFNEEYAAGNNLIYQVKDFKGETQTGLPSLTEEFGDNRISLDVSTLVSGMYVIEIRNDKNETLYLRFKVV